MNKELFVTVTAVCGLFIAGIVMVGIHEEAKPVEGNYAPKPNASLYPHEEMFRREAEKAAKESDRLSVILAQEQYLIANGYLGHGNGRKPTEEEHKAFMDTLAKYLPDTNYVPKPIKLPVPARTSSKTTIVDDLQYELDMANDKIEKLELRLSELESE